MQDLAAPPPLPPPQWHHRLTFFLFLFLFLPPPASYQTATEPRSPQSGSGPGLGRRPALGMCPHWGCADAGLFPLRSPGQHLMCACRGVTSAGPGLLLGLAKRLPVLGRVPSLACGQGWAGEWTCTESWGLTAGSWEPGVTGQAEGGRRRGRLSRGP